MSRALDGALLSCGGLAFGLESAVVSFNRFPQLGIAIARRCTLSLAAAYFDDERLSKQFLMLIVLKLAFAWCSV
jgi:hypothetical protein